MSISEFSFPEEFHLPDGTKPGNVMTNGMVYVGQNEEKEDCYAYQGISKTLFFGAYDSTGKFVKGRISPLVAAKQDWQLAADVEGQLLPYAGIGKFLADHPNLKLLTSEDLKLVHSSLKGEMVSAANMHSFWLSDQLAGRSLLWQQWFDDGQQNHYRRDLLNSERFPCRPIPVRSFNLDGREWFKTLFQSGKPLTKADVTKVEKILKDERLPATGETKKTLKAIRKYAEHGQEITFPMPKSPDNAFSKNFDRKKHSKLKLPEIPRKLDI